MTWGNEGQTMVLPQVTTYAWDEDERMRAVSAVAFGKMIAEQKVNTEVEQVIEQLGTLSRDRASLVRQCAVHSLGKICSETVIPFLTRALQDPDLEVVATASTILDHYKTYPGPSANSSEPTLPENSALKEQNQSL